MTQLLVGDLVWIPHNTYGFEAQPPVSYRYKIKGPTYGLVVEVEEQLVKVSLSNVPQSEVFWFRPNEIYKENGDIYGKVC